MCDSKFEAAVIMEDEQAIDYARQISADLQVEANEGAKVLPSQAYSFNQLSLALKKYTESAYALSLDFINLNDSFDNLTARSNKLSAEYDSLLALSDALRSSASQKRC